MKSGQKNYKAQASVRFYPQKKDELERTIHKLIAEAGQLSTANSVSKSPVKAIISPHAAYVYSGLCAAQAYKELEPQKDQIKRVVLFGPSHRHGFQGVASPSYDTWSTPLGDVPIGVNKLRQLVDEYKCLSINNDAHENEYSLDVQVPLLQTVLGEFELLPFSIGRVPFNEVSKLIDHFWDDSSTLIVISTDLSHFLSDAAARVKDGNTAKLISSFRTKGLDAKAACGHIGVAGLISYANDKNVSIEQLGLCNSSDAIGGKDQVVGYGSWIFRQKKLTKDELIIREFGGKLLNTAAAAIKRKIATGVVPNVTLDNCPEPLQTARATFITLEQDGKLRGCIGSMVGYRALVSDVVHNACAASEDSRFKNLKKSELEGIMLSISLLSPLQRMTFENEQQLIDQLTPYEDGVLIQDSVLRKDSKFRSVFLPQVWDAYSNPKDFLQQLKVKAGLAPDYWGDEMVAWKYSVVKTSALVE